MSVKNTAKNIDEFESEFRKRYARWSPVVWQKLVDESIPALLSSNAALPDESLDKIVEAYVKLCGEGIGIGRLFTNGNNLSNLFFIEKIPTLLAKCGDAKAQIEMLVSLWNLCDAVEKQASWVEPIIKLRLAKIQDLALIEIEVDQFAKFLELPNDVDVTEVSAADLQLKVCDTAYLGFFLPTAIEVVAPPVLAITGNSPNDWLQLSVFAPDASVISVEKIAEPKSAFGSGQAAPADFLKMLNFKLSPRDFVKNPIVAAALFQESQNIWLWSRKEV